MGKKNISFMCIIKIVHWGNQVHDSLTVLLISTARPTRHGLAHI